MFKKKLDDMHRKRGEDWVHHLDLFYYRISLYEQEKYEEAVQTFDRILVNRKWKEVLFTNKSNGPV